MGTGRAADHDAGKSYRRNAIPVKGEDLKWFDLHCDTLTACGEQGLSMRSNDKTQLDFERLRGAGALAQCFAVFIDRGACDQRGVSPWNRYEELRDLFYEEVTKSGDLVRRTGTAEELADAEAAGRVGAVLTVEGGELLWDGECEACGRGAKKAHGATPADDGDPKSVPETLYRRLDRMWLDGVRMLTLTWNYENCLGSPNGSAGGLKRAGFEAAAYMQELGMIVDVSHLSDRGFFDVMKTAKKPVAASHSCARSLCGHPRNLTDEQLRAIGENGGVVGVNFHAPFLNENGISGSVEEVARHLTQIINCAGSAACALGSDYDGIPEDPAWGGVEGMPHLLEALSKRFGAGIMNNICYKNALRLFAQCSAKTGRTFPQC